MSNLIDAISNLVKYKSNTILENSRGKNRANNTGDGLEEFVMDLFAGTFNEERNSQDRSEKIEDTFSYRGNKSNPPDAMLKNGDAIEVKKIESKNADLALNSSHPKNKLYANSPMITNACKTAEENGWKVKDILYIVGFVKESRIRGLAIVYGMDYCAEESCYLRIKNCIAETIQEISTIEFSESRELGHINRIDPLGITYMRIRGMWGIENPWKVFKYIHKEDFKNNFSLMCLINEEKWKTFSNRSTLIQLEKSEEKLQLKDVKIKDPDNPVKLRNAKLITFSF